MNIKFIKRAKQSYIPSSKMGTDPVSKMECCKDIFQLDKA